MNTSIVVDYKPPAHLATERTGPPGGPQKLVSSLEGLRQPPGQISPIPPTSMAQQAARILKRRIQASRQSGYSWNNKCTCSRPLLEAPAAVNPQPRGCLLQISPSCSKRNCTYHISTRRILNCDSHDFSPPKDDHDTMPGFTSEDAKEPSNLLSSQDHKSHVLTEASDHSHSHGSDAKSLLEGREARPTMPSAEESSLEVDDDVKARNIRSRERVQILRARVVRTRYLAIHSRDKVRECRERSQDATKHLMLAIDRLMALGDVQNLKDLGPYYETARAAQDELGPVEAAYDALQIRLIDEEQDLEQEEHHHYRNSTIPLFKLPDSKIDQTLSPLMEPQHPTDDDVPEFSLGNDLFQEYLGRVTAAEELKEELEEIINKNHELIEEETFRKRNGLKLSPKQLGLLSEFSERHGSLVDTLKSVEVHISALRKKCLKEKLFNDTDYAYEPRDWFVEDVMDTVFDARERSPLQAAAAYVKQPIRDINFQDKRVYVNNWMLEWVQDSPVEVLRLRDWIYSKFSDLESEPPESDKWSELALSWWDKDEAGKSANNNNNSIMSALTADPANTTLPGLSGISLLFVDGNNPVQEDGLASQSDSQSSLEIRNNARKSESINRLQSKSHGDADNIRDDDEPIEDTIPLPCTDTPRIEDANSLSQATILDLNSPPR